MVRIGGAIASKNSETRDTRRLARFRIAESLKEHRLGLALAARKRTRGGSIRDVTLLLGPKGHYFVLYR